jgi:hypothetical protein
VVLVVVVAALRVYLSSDVYYRGVTGCNTSAVCCNRRVKRQEKSGEYYAVWNVLAQWFIA